MIDVASLYFGDRFVKHYEYDEMKRQVSIQVNALSIVKLSDFYDPNVDSPIIDAIIRFHEVSEYKQEPEDKKINDAIYEISMESGRFVIDCGFIDASGCTGDVRISFQRA